VKGSTALRLALAANAGMLALLAVSGAALSGEADPEPWNGSVTLVSDYRFRGVSQSWREPALQGHLQYDHRSGWYGGVWASTVSDNVYPGAHFEVDYYAGHERSFANGIGYDLGLIYYTHPGARAEEQVGSPEERFDGTVAYLDLRWRDFGIKYWYGLNGGARGSRYIEGYADFKLGAGWTLGLHAGKQTVRDDPALDYNDWRVSITKEIEKWTLGLAWSNTDADRELYSVADSTGSRVKQLAGPAWVAWIRRSF
jgi:uncharacterized protein (TIGR02001 family)